ncbi:rCG45189 [Rattus norvegicus]|uniref:RCG45189 n=1 Tax=Rattus norvegicus TaxID=10116 RepID=A6KLQ1_RAT|nr:rCG45189 [Rattus norvegicus]
MVKLQVTSEHLRSFSRNR